MAGFSTSAKFLSAVILGASLLLASPGRAQSLLALSGGNGTPPPAGKTKTATAVDAAAVAPDALPKVLLAGQVQSPFGPLPGAYIHLLDYPSRGAVANADGSFALEVPAASGKLRAVVSYAGLPDQAVLLPLHEANLLLVPWQEEEFKSAKIKFKDNKMKVPARSGY